MKEETGCFTYEDILRLPYNGVLRHPRMSLHDRAAQFMPFMALTGYEASVTEAARQTQELREQDEEVLSDLNRKLHILLEHVKEQPEVTIHYFCPDEKKSGGAYVSITGEVKKLDTYRGRIVLTDGTEIVLEHIIELQSRLFHKV